MDKKKDKYWDNAVLLNKEISVIGFNAIKQYPLSKNVGSLETSKHFFSPKSGKKILDIGCGYGRFLFECYDKGLECHGIDFSKNMIEKGRQLAEISGKKITFYHDSIKNFNFPDNSFDYIWCYGVTSYLSLYELKLLLQKISKILKPAGSAFLEFRNKWHIMAIFTEFLLTFRAPDISGTRKSYSIPQIKKIITPFNFKIKRILSESNILFPMFIPKNAGKFNELATESMPKNLNKIHFIPIFPEKIITILYRFFNFLWRASINGNKFATFLSKDYIIVLDK